MLQGLANAQNAAESAWEFSCALTENCSSVSTVWLLDGPEQVETIGVGHGVFEEWALLFKATDIAFQNYNLEIMYIWGQMGHFCVLGALWTL